MKYALLKKKKKSATNKIIKVKRKNRVTLIMLFN